MSGIRLLVFLISAAAALPAQPPTFHTDAGEILVDFVVRDKKGKTLPGLSSADVRVYENGVEQPVVSFRERRNGTSGEASLPSVLVPQTPASASGRHLPVNSRYVVLVFDRINREPRRLARQAALHFVENNVRSGVLVAVYKLDRNLDPIQLHTDDVKDLRGAVLRATDAEKTDLDSGSPGREQFALLTRQGEGAASAAAQAAQGDAQPTGQPDPSDRSFEQSNVVAQQMLEHSATVNREDLGRVPLFALWTLIRDLSNIPGRKSIVYFSGGLELPNALRPQFRSMLSDANRANVSFYAIDSRGQSPNSETRAALAELAENTGGVLFAKTNDFRPAMTRLSEELNSYYEITYRSSNPALDGRYRAISVTVDRPNATVQARGGYLALPQLGGESFRSFEVPLLRALGRTPPPRDLDFRACILRFRRLDDEQQGALVFDMPLDQVTSARDEAEGKWRSHLSVLALVKDQQGRVAAKLSRDVPLNEPLDRLAGFRRGRFIVTQPVFLRPGRYTVETAAADVDGQRVASSKSVFVVTPSPPPGPRLSDIVLIRRVEKPAENPDPADPLQLNSGRVIPTLLDIIPREESSLLSVFLMLYPEDGAAPPRLILDFLQNGKLITRSTPELPPPAAPGAIPYFASLPLKSVSPGQYEFRATLVQDQKAAQRTLSVTIE